MKLTTQKDYEQFKEACQYWIDYFGFHDWAVCYEWRKCEDAQANFWIDHQGKIVTIRLHKGYVTNPIENIAKHEIIESLLLDKIERMAMERRYTAEDIAEEIHRITRILENRLKRG